MSMPQVIQVEKVSKYGSDLIYPRNELAEKACALWGQKTITPRNIGALKDMGFIVEQVVMANGKPIKTGEL